MKASTTSWTITGLGTAVSSLGAVMLKRKNEIGLGVLGFGLAHVVLGLLDLTRPTIRKS